MAQYKLQQLPPREPLLSEEAHAYARKVAADPELARKFLKEAGIMDENGELAAPYRIEE